MRMGEPKGGSVCGSWIVRRLIAPDACIRKSLEFARRVWLNLCRWVSPARGDVSGF
jgi:hypothetical protein